MGGSLHGAVHLILENSLSVATGFFTNTLCFGLEREFVKRDAHTNNLIASGDLSPTGSDFIFGNDVPNPCRYFCGQEQELEQLHQMLLEHGKVFLQRIAGVGKSELAKAYARQHKKEYGNGSCQRCSVETSGRLALPVRP